MASAFWVGGTATWNSTPGTKWATTSGGAGGAAVPTAADDVFFDALSLGTSVVTLSAMPCRSLNCTGFTGTLSHPSGTTLTIGDGTAGASNVALLLVALMTYTLSSASTSALSFVSTSATQQTIATGTKVLGNWTVNGAGSSYSLSDANTTGATATVTLTVGALTTNNQTVSWGFFASSGAGVRSLTLGSSAVALTGTGTVWTTTVVTNLTLSAGTSTITCSGASATFSGGTMTFNNLVMNGSGAARLGNAGQTYTNLTRTGTAVKTDTWTTFGNQTITGTLTITGNSAVNRMLVISDTLGTARTLTAAAVSLSNADFQDIVGAGAASPFTGTSLGDALGNSGITFTTAAAQTHTTAAGGNWSDVTVWTSRVPLPQDDVIVDVNTTGTLTADMPRLGKDITFTGFGGTAAFSSVANVVFGNLTLATGMTISGTQVLSLSGRGSQTVTSAGRTLTQGVTLSASAGTYTIQDALTTAGPVIISVGTLAGNGFNVTATTVTLSGALSAVVMGSGTWSLTGAGAGATLWSCNSASTVTSSTSTIVIATAATGSRTFAGGGKVYGTLTYTVAGSTGPLVITGANTFAINFSDATNARTLTLPASTTTTITAFNVNGTVGKLMTVNSSTPGTAATLSKASGVIACDYLSIQDSIATGGALWFAGPDSTNVSGNTGWVFTWPAITLADTGGGADALSSTVAATVTDAGTGVGAAPVVSTASSLADTGSGTDTSALTATIASADTATGSDPVGGASVVAQSAEIGASADTLSVSALAVQSDSGTGGDAGVVSASLGAADTATGADAFALLAAALAADVAVMLDALSSTAGVVFTDSGSGADAAGAGIPALVADTAVGVDSQTVAVAASVGDTAIALDAVGALLSLALAADTGVVSDAALVTALVVLADTAFGRDLLAFSGILLPPSSGRASLSLGSDGGRVVNA